MHSLTIEYRPDNFPDWLPWKKFEHAFGMIGALGSLRNGAMPNAKAGFYPRQPLGKPPTLYDTESTNRLLRRGFEFQVRFRGKGHVVIDRFRIHAQKLVEKSRAK